MNILPTPSELIAHLDRFVHSQARAKQDLAVAVYNHYLSQAVRDRDGIDLGRHHILLLGPTGVGKTFLVKTLAEHLGVPFGFTSAAGLVEAGYKGNSVENLLETLLARAGGDPRKAEKGIVFLDEIDKIRRADTGGQRDISGEGVQNALLTMLDGRLSDGDDSRRHAAIDTSRLLFVCAGAFVDLDQIVQRRLGQGRARLGFTPRPAEPQEVLAGQPLYATLCQAETRDLVEFGMIPEFIGRFATITVLHDLPKSALRAILDGGVERSALARQQELARLHGIELELTGEALDAIAEEAEALGTGARGLARLVGRSVDSVDHRWPELADEGVVRVRITRATLAGGPPELERGAHVAPPQAEALRRACLSGMPSPPVQGLGPKSEASPWQRIEGWSPDQCRAEIERLKRDELDWQGASSTTQKWWGTFETENRERPALVLRVCLELVQRKATLQEFFLAYVYSNTDNIQANLHYLEYVRLKREEEAKRRKPDGGGK